MKANPRSIIRAHYESLVDYRNGTRHRPDYVVFLGVPVVGFIAACALGLSLPEGASQGLLTVTGLLSAFFFGVMLQITERALDWADQEPPQGSDTTWEAKFLTEIAANAGYASLVSIATAAVFVVVLLAKGVVLTVASALGLALAVHLVLLLTMVIGRVFAVTTERLNDVRSGVKKAKVMALPDRRAGSNGS